MTSLTEVKTKQNSGVSSAEILYQSWDIHLQTQKSLLGLCLIESET